MNQPLDLGSLRITRPLCGCHRVGTRRALAPLGQRAERAVANRTDKERKRREHGLSVKTLPVELYLDMLENGLPPITHEEGMRGQVDDSLLVDSQRRE